MFFRHLETSWNSKLYGFDNLPATWLHEISPIFSPPRGEAWAHLPVSGVNHCAAAAGKSSHRSSAKKSRQRPESTVWCMNQSLPFFFCFWQPEAYAAANADANSVFAKRKHHECPTKSGPINCQNEKLSFSRPAFWNCGQLWPPHRPRVGRGLHEDHELIRRTAQADTLSTSMKLCPIMVSADRRPTWNTRSDLWTA